MKIRKEKCEICEEKRKSVLDTHHVIPQTDPRCTDNINNLICLCANCHRSVHRGEFIIEGYFLTTGGYKWFWYKNGENFTVRPGIFLKDDGKADIVWS